MNGITFHLLIRLSHLVNKTPFFLYYHRNALILAKYKTAILSKELDLIKNTCQTYIIKYVSKTIRNNLPLIILDSKEDESMRESLFTIGEEVKIKASGESVTIYKCQYVKNMKRYSYTVKEHPNTFFFEEELIKE